MLADKFPACGHADCCSSTGIAGEELTFGRGTLDDSGYWEIPCSKCARLFEKLHPEMAPCWPFEIDDDEM